MKEIRGKEAVKYAAAKGLFVNIDEAFLVEAESRLRGHPVSMAEVEDQLGEALDEAFEPSKLVKGNERFELIAGRYGEDWIYLPLEGNHPLIEEDILIQIFKRRTPTFGGGDILDVVTNDFPALEGTGFPKSATVNLMFHAALRLVNKNQLVAIDDKRCYGNTFFHISRNG